MENTKSASGSIDSHSSLQNSDSVTKKLSVDRLSGTGSSMSGSSSNDLLNFAVARPTVSLHYMILCTYVSEALDLVSII